MFCAFIHKRFKEACSHGIEEKKDISVCGVDMVEVISERLKFREVADAG